MTGGWGGLRSDLLDLHSVTKLSKTSKQVIVLPPLLKMNRDIPPRKPLAQIDRALKQIMKTQVHLIYAVRAFDGDASHTVARPILDRLNDIASVGVGAHDIPQREAVGEEGNTADLEEVLVQPLTPELLEFWLPSMSSRAARSMKLGVGRLTGLE